MVKNKIFLLIILLFFMPQCLGMENDEKLLDKEYAENFLEQLPAEMLFCIFKALLKSYLTDFMINENNFALFYIKNLRLVNNNFKKFVDANKLNTLKLLIKEMLFFEHDLQYDSLNNMLSEILRTDYTLENEKKAVLLIIMGANPNLEINWRSEDKNKDRADSILMFISLSGRFENLINLLHKFGGSINDVDHENGSPLIAATVNEKIDIVKVLLENGANIELNHKGLTAVDIARVNRNEEILALFESRWKITQIFLLAFGLVHQFLIEYRTFT